MEKIWLTDRYAGFKSIVEAGKVVCPVVYEARGEAAAGGSPDR
jgi:hypothetical protein